MDGDLPPGTTQEDLDRQLDSLGDSLGWADDEWCEDCGESRLCGCDRAEQDW